MPCGCHSQEAPRQALFAVDLELRGFHVAHHLGVPGAGPQVLAHGEEVHLCGAQVVHHAEHLASCFSEAQHQARLGEGAGKRAFGTGQQVHGVAVTGSRADLSIAAGHRFHVVVIDVGPSRGHHRERPRLVAKVRGQHLDAGGGTRRAYRPDAGREVGGTAVGEIVAVHRGDHHVSQPEFGDRGRQAGGLVGVHRIGTAGVDVAERAGARAGAPQNHHAGVPSRPALVEVGAGGFLAARVETQALYQRPGLLQCGALPQPDLEPGGLALPTRKGLGTKAFAGNFHAPSVSPLSLGVNAGCGERAPKRLKSRRSVEEAGFA